MIKFTTTLEKFAQKGEKTSWTYLVIEEELAQQLNKGVKKSYRVKGFINEVSFAQIAIMPMGDGTFILPLNKEIRKQINCKIGDEVHIKVSLDKEDKPLNAELLACIELEPHAKIYFESLPKSHQRYFSNWVDGAKTAATKEKRLLTIIESLNNKWDYPTMIKFYKS